MDIVFLDANVLFSAAYQKQSGILRFWKLKRVKLITSRYAAEEAARNLSQSIQQDRLNQLLEKMTIINSTYFDLVLPKEIKLPKKDEPIFLAALAGHANYLITGDVKDFGAYYGKEIEGIAILPPSEYLNLWID